MTVTARATAMPRIAAPPPRTSAGATSPLAKEGTTTSSVTRPTIAEVAICSSPKAVAPTSASRNQRFCSQEPMSRRFSPGISTAGCWEPLRGRTAEGREGSRSERAESDRAGREVVARGFMR